MSIDPKPRKHLAHPDHAADAVFELQLVRLIDMAGGDDGHNAY
jgi:hypothetical protein